MLTCEDTLGQWNNIAKDITQPLHDKFPEMAKLIQWALSYCCDTEISFPTTNTMLPYYKLIHTQSKIGWRQILKGRWATDWVDAIEEISPGTGEKEMTNLTLSIWKAILNVWKARCDTLHKDTTENKNKISQQLQPQVQAIYALKYKLDAVDKRVLDTPIDTTLKLPPKILKDWIHKTGNFIKEGIKRANVRLKANNNSITKYFKTLASTNSTSTSISGNLHNNDAMTNPTSRTRKENQHPP
jgi:hypothetical protein